VRGAAPEDVRGHDVGGLRIARAHGLGLALAVCLIMCVLAAAGCSSGRSADERPAGETSAETSAAKTTTETASGEATEFAPAELEEPDGSPKDDPSMPRKDAQGRTPDQAVTELFRATSARDFRRMYSLYATPEVDYATAEREWKQADEAYDSYAAREVRVRRDGLAFVNVVYSGATTPLDGERYPVVAGEPGEWWAVHMADGVWKVRWLPRQ